MLFCKSSTILFKIINRIKLDILNLKVLEYCFYIYILKIIIKYKYNNCF